MSEYKIRVDVRRVEDLLRIGVAVAFSLSRVWILDDLRELAAFSMVAVGGGGDTMRARFKGRAERLPSLFPWCLTMAVLVVNRWQSDKAIRGDPYQRSHRHHRPRD